VKITEDQWLTGTRRKIVEFVFWFMCESQSRVMRMSYDIKRHDMLDVTYEYYLGKDYRENYKPPPKGGVVPTILSNHVSCFDIHAIGILTGGKNCYAAASFIKNIPFIGDVCSAIGSVYIPRAASKDKLIETLDGLVYRTKVNELHGTFPPTVIFPEGTTSNNINLMKFRRGAFYAMR